MRSLLFAIIYLFSSSVSASESFDLALNLFKTKAYRKNAVDWIKVEKQSRSILNLDGEDDAINFLVKELGDHHTSYWPKNSDRESKQNTLPRMDSGIATISNSVFNVPVLQINTWMGKDQVDASQRVREELLKATRINSCGLILDFSFNQGGNMWPMVIGLSPLLHNGKLGAFVGPENSRTEIEKIDGAIFLSGGPHFLNYKLEESDIGKLNAIAIVLGSLTSSSGEITPMLFIGQDNVETFGEKTSGYTSANQVFRLSNGGTLLLTTSQTEDRSGNIHALGIEPTKKSDSPYQDAANWVKKRCGQEVPNKQSQQDSPVGSPLL